MLTFLLALLFISSLLFLGVHEDWLQKGSPHFLLGWLLAIIGTTSALLLMVQLCDEIECLVRGGMVYFTGRGYVNLNLAAIFFAVF